MKISKILLTSSLVMTGLAAAPAASAAVIYLNFEGIATYPTGSGTVIGNYYNGGAASNGAVGPNYGVQFTTGGQLLCLNTAGTECSNTSKGGQGIPASQFYGLFFPTANPTMNVAAGFDTGFSFNYTAPFTTGTIVNVYAGLNGTGLLLATLSLPLTTTGTCNTTISQGAQYCPFASASLSFSGIARSVVFGGTVNSQVFDDFTFGSTSVGAAVPEPATWGMMILGFGMIGAASRSRKVKTSVKFA